jgi:hypothetical protein
MAGAGGRRPRGRRRGGTAPSPTSTSSSTSPSPAARSSSTRQATRRTHASPNFNAPTPLPTRLDGSITAACPGARFLLRPSIDQASKCVPLCCAWSERAAIWHRLHEQTLKFQTIWASVTHAPLQCFHTSPGDTYIWAPVILVTRPALPNLDCYIYLFGIMTKLLLCS